MYSWDDRMEDWARPGAYRFDAARAAARKKDAERARRKGPRTYHRRNAPVMELVDPKRRITTQSPNPLIVAVDVTGSMQTWPFEIFDRLPLLYQTLSQYRPDLEISFAAIGDARCDDYPLQVTDFARGYDLEERLKALYGEGRGGDPPESYGLFAYYVLHRVEIAPTEEKPFLIVFGDITMHSKVRVSEIQHFIGDGVQGDVDAVTTWQEVAKTWNVWFLRRPGGRKNDDVDRQWGRAIGSQKIVHINDELRAVDYCMGLIARHWGKFTDFQDNMRARQDDDMVQAVANSLLSVQVEGELPPTRKET
jgi:hypothetical protein